MNAAQDRAGRHKITPANAFATVNHARIAARLPLLSEPVLPLVGPPVLPPVTLTATHRGDAFVLTLTSPAPYGQAVCLQAAPPRVPGSPTSAPPSAFKPIGTLPSLAEGPNTITDLYTARYGTPEVGAEIPLRLVAVSDAGLRSPALLAAAVSHLPIAPAPFQQAHDSKSAGSITPPGTRKAMSCRTSERQRYKLLRPRGPGLSLAKCFTPPAQAPACRFIPPAHAQVQYTA